MSDQKTIRSFWMVFIASLALIVIVMAMATAALQVATSEEDARSGVKATIPASTPLTPPLPSPTWVDRALTAFITFLLTFILSGRFILLMGVLLFYGFIVAYIAPNAWQKVRLRFKKRFGKVATEKAKLPRGRK